MRAPANWPKTFASALVLLGLRLHVVGVHGSSSASETAVTATPAASPATEVCEARTINYITHTLPQQCLRTSWTSPTPTPTDESTGQATASTPTTTIAEDSGPTQDNGAAQEQDSQDDQEELAASSFMSFEEWKEMMLRKSGQDPANIKAHKQREHRERDPSLNNADVDSFGEEGEISLEFDALAEKVSEITSSTREAAPDAGEVAKEEQVLYDDGKTQYYRSKDAGKTCKERFSYASFDAGATVLKTNSGAKNAKAILVENKDSYMLLECRAQNKFVIVELSDDILVDTVVIANFEFFSSMIRKFRVSVSDRYPVKLDKWVDLGTFEARNSRDIQAFLIEHPQIYTKYIRIEFLSHWGNEFYCPVSLLRVHGTRMLDTWKEPNHDDEPEQIEGSVEEPAAEAKQVEEYAGPDNSSVVAEEEQAPEVVTEMGLSPWRPVFHSNFSLEMCELRSPTTAEPTPVESDSNALKQPPAAPDSVTPRPSAPSVANEESLSRNSSSEPASPEAPVSGQTTNSTASTAPSAPPQASSNSTANNSGHRQAEARADAPNNSSSVTATTSRNKTSTVSSPSASPTVQESFFKTITKRLQLLESNTSLSLQYIEEQSRFLQDVLLKMERRQVTRVDSFLDTLNKTVLSELHNVRTQYDQLWQSTVIALETQREQSQREIVALTSRLNILADEVVFQKRMAILQSVLLLSCLVLVIFSRGGLAALDGASFPSFPPASASAVYRRYGYTYPPGRSDSISGISMPGSSPPGAQQPTANGNSNTLAASALPRHLYQSSSYKDKMLPLTPPSEYSRESTPATNRYRSPESSFAYEQLDDGVDGTPPCQPPTAVAAVVEGFEGVQTRPRTAPPDAEISSLESQTGAGQANTPDATAPPQREEARQGGEGITSEPDQNLDQTQEHEQQLLPLQNGQAPSPLSTIPHMGGVGPAGLRKPLPALPEDPS